MKKVVSFGLLGALGCLAGWAVGEPLLRVLTPWARAAGAAPAFIMDPEAPSPPAAPLNRGGEVSAPEAPPAPAPFYVPTAAAPPPPSADFAGRLERAGAGKGQVQIALSWANTNDLDLHVIEPTGTRSGRTENARPPEASSMSTAISPARVSSSRRNRSSISTTARARRRATTGST